MCYRWYHGEISGQTAIERLQSCEVGAFLVRLSSSERDALVLSLLTAGGVVHTRFQRIPEAGYSFSGIGEGGADLEAETLPELIARSAHVMGLRFPCSVGSAFKPKMEGTYLTAQNVNAKSKNI